MPFSGKVGSVNQMALMLNSKASLISKMAVISRTSGMRQGDWDAPFFILVHRWF